jgi:hypothetical protein
MPETFLNVQEFAYEMAGAISPSKILDPKRCPAPLPTSGCLKKATVEKWEAGVRIGKGKFSLSAPAPAPSATGGHEARNVLNETMATVSTAAVRKTLRWGTPAGTTGATQPAKGVYPRRSGLQALT